MNVPASPSAARAVPQPYLELDWPDAEGDYVILLRGVPKTSVVVHGATPEEALFRFGDALRLTFETVPAALGAVETPQPPINEWVSRLLRAIDPDEGVDIGALELLAAEMHRAVTASPAVPAPQQIKHGFECPECGFGVAVDEDGCCRTCGSDTKPKVAAVPAQPDVQALTPRQPHDDPQQNEFVVWFCDTCGVLSMSGSGPHGHTMSRFIARPAPYAMDK